MFSEMANGKLKPAKINVASARHPGPCCQHRKINADPRMNLERGVRWMSAARSTTRRRNVRVTNYGDKVTSTWFLSALISEVSSGGTPSGAVVIRSA